MNMPTDSPYFPLNVELNYSYSLGELKPYFDALVDSRALASTCPSCGKTDFPPRLICDEDQAATEWTEIEGSGQIVEFTQGKDAQGKYVCFALIKMNGASNLCLGRLVGENFEIGDLVRIQALDSVVQHPAQNLAFVKPS